MNAKNNLNPTVDIIIPNYNKGLFIEECIESAYNVISKRKGKMINGTFVKNK